jgi:hypothetical protein
MRGAADCVSADDDEFRHRERIAAFAGSCDLHWDDHGAGDSYRHEIEGDGDADL